MVDSLEPRSVMLTAVLPNLGPPGKYIYAAGGAIFGEASGEVGFVGLGPQPPWIGWLAAAEDPSGAGPKWYTALVTVCAL